VDSRFQTPEVVWFRAESESVADGEFWVAGPGADVDPAASFESVPQLLVSLMVSDEQSAGSAGKTTAAAVG